jgi:D-amino peptidase
MKLFISADMEGCTGVTTGDDVNPGKASYERFRKLLTRDVNAAIEGALDAGVKEILVNEAHNGMRNILIEDLIPDARIISGFEGKDLCMMEGVNSSFDAVFLIGYHARAGTEKAILSHTLFGGIHNFWVNEVLVGESGISASLAGYFGVPIALVTGDDKVASEVLDLLGPLETAVLKKGVSRFSADCLPPKETSKIIRERAKIAVENVKDYSPYIVENPVKIEVEFTSVSMANYASTIPGIHKKDSRTISLSSKNMVEAWKLAWPGIFFAISAVRAMRR